VVPGRQAERFLQLPGQERRGRAGRQDRHHLRGRQGRSHPRHLQGTADPRLQVRQRPEEPGREEGRPGHHLPAHVHRGRGGHAGLRPHRCHPLRGIRRLLRPVPARPHRGRRRGADHHRRRAVPGWQKHPPETRRGRGPDPGRLRFHQERGGLPAHRRPRRHGPRTRPLVARRGGQPGRNLRTGMGGRRAPPVPALHLRLHRQAQGRAALHRRLPAGGHHDHEVDLRPEAHRRVLVHRRHRLGHRPHLHHLRPPGLRRHRDRVRGRAHLPGRRPLLEDDPGPQGQHLLHRPHRHPFPDQGRRHQSGRASEELRPVQPARAGLRGRAHQPGSLDVVPREHRRR
jgi:hypothetical protein